MIILFDVYFYGTSAEEPDDVCAYETTVEIDDRDFDNEYMWDDVAETLLNCDYASELSDYDIDRVVFRSQIDETYVPIDVRWVCSDEYKVY